MLRDLGVGVSAPANGQQRQIDRRSAVDFQAMESFVSEFVGAGARECCDRTARPRCCFKIGVSSAGT